jgi:flagellar M-ring protein FliF
MQARQIVANMSPKGWVKIGVGAAAVIVFLFFMMQMASAPSYSTLMTGLDPAQTGKITSTLDTKGIGYQLQNGGTALAVDSSKTSQARVALATGGLLGSQQPGFSLFDKQQLGSSNFQQQITYQRALEGQLAQTIQTIQGVSSAQVQIVLPNPQDQLFSAQAQPTTAAVLLSGSTSLDPSSVRGIAQLVASSVPGLQIGKVTITDANGQLLWPTGDTGTGGTLVSKQAAGARYDSMMAAQLNAMLAQTLGPNKAYVQVNADVDANQVKSDTLTYKGKPIPLAQTQNTESLTGGGTAAGGTAGTAGNIPGVAAAGGTNSGSKYNHKQTSTTYGVNKNVTHEIVAPGAINRQSVSVLVDASVPKSAIPTLQAAVSNAAGIQNKRGDTVSFGQVTFPKPATATNTQAASPIMSYAKYGAVALGAIIFLFFIARLLRRRENEPFAGNPTWVRELESPRPLAALEAAEAAQPTRVAQLNTPVNVAKRQIEDLVERDPDRVAQQVRAWMSED